MVKCINCINWDYDPDRCEDYASGGETVFECNVVENGKHLFHYEGYDITTKDFIHELRRKRECKYFIDFREQE